MSRIDTKGFSNLKENEEFTKFKDKLANLGLVPIYDMDKLYIYKINKTDKLNELYKNYKDNLSEVYKTVFSKPSYDPYQHPSYFQAFGDLIKYDIPTDEELYEKFGFNDKEKINTYLKNNAGYVKRQTVKDNKVIEEYSLETFDEVIDRLKREYSTFTFRRKSKLASLTSLTLYKDYFSLEVIVNAIYEFLYSKKLEYNRIFMSDIDILNIISMPFSNCEKRLSLLDKRETINDIIDALDIECIYSGSLTDIPYIGLDGNIKEVKCNINRIASDNAKLLFSGEFKDTYDKIMKSKVKTL